MQRKYRRLLVLGSFLSLLFLLSFYKSQIMPPAGEIYTFSAGSQGSTYEKVAQVVAKNTTLNLSIESSAGSIENVSKLRDKKASFVIAQDDIAQYAFHGIRNQQKTRNLKYLIPLFPEYVQIVVPINSNINVLGDMRGKKICYGTRGSGSYFNALDILKDIELRESIDYTAVLESPFNCILEMNNDASYADVVVLTSHTEQSLDSSQTKRFYLSEEFIDSLVARHTYYKKAVTIDKQGQEHPHLSVDAFIFTRKDVPPAVARQLATEIATNWNRLQTSIGSTPDLKIRRSTGAINYHFGANSAYNDLNLSNANYLLPFLLGLWILFFLLCTYSEKQKSNYNRLGDGALYSNTGNVFFKALGKISPFFIGINFIVIFIILSVFVLRIVEQFFAPSTHSVSPFLLMGFSENILWLFTYIASGFTSDGVYPITSAGKLIVAALALSGVIGPITGVIFLINLANKRVQKILMGLGSTDLNQHVVICGWNEKAPGIIYTLTGKDVDEKMSIALVADFDEKYPLEKFNFNSALVFYCKGKSNDVKILERANVKRAKSVIVLADFDGNEDHNVDSILTVMNIRKLNPDVHICAELEYLDNIDYFTSCGCDTLISTNLIISRLAATAIIDPMIVDYIMDLITYHDHDELYSIEVSEIPWMESYVGKSLRLLETVLLSNGINIVGVIDGKNAKDSLHSFNFDTDNGLKALLDANDSSVAIKSEMTLLFAAKSRRDIFLKKSVQNKTNDTGLENVAFDIQLPKQRKILALGGDLALSDLEDSLKNVFDELVFTKVDTDKHNIRTIEQANGFIDGCYDEVIIMSSQKQRNAVASEEDLNNIDANLILLTRLFRGIFDDRKQKPLIISETLNIKNKQLFLSAGASSVLPTILLVERFLTKETYDKNHVTDFIMSLLNLNDGIHLYAHTVISGDGFHGQLYKDILHTEIEGVRLMGWLPFSQRGELLNKQDDFEYHFRTVIDKRIKSERAAENDVIILMIEKRELYTTLDYKLENLDFVKNLNIGT